MNDKKLARVLRLWAQQRVYDMREPASVEVFDQDADRLVNLHT